jgi:hypothetical protein
MAISIIDIRMLWPHWGNAEIKITKPHKRQKMSVSCIAKGTKWLTPIWNCRKNWTNYSLMKLFVLLNKKVDIF